MKLPNRTDSNIFECKSSLFLSASTEVKKCTTWTVKFVVNELLPTHLHYLVKSRLLSALSKTHYITISYWTTVKLGNKERFDKEQFGIKGPYPVSNLPFTS